MCCYWLVYGIWNSIDLICFALNLYSDGYGIPLNPW